MLINPLKDFKEHMIFKVKLIYWFMTQGILVIFTYYINNFLPQLSLIY